MASKTISDAEPNQNANLQENIEIHHNLTTSTQPASDARSLHFNAQSALDKEPKPAQKTELAKISIEICIDRGCASFETSDGKKFPIGPLSKYLSMLHQSKALRDCEIHISFDPSRFVWNDAETAITAREKFAKLSQDIHSIAHLWKYRRVVTELHKYPKRAKKVLALSDFCEGLFGQDRSILACRQLEISLTDDWPFSDVTNFTPYKRLIVKEMLQDHLSKDQQLHCAFLDAIYEKKIPEKIDIILELCYNKSTDAFEKELKKRFKPSKGMIFNFKVLSPRIIPYVLHDNDYGIVEIKPLPNGAQARYLARIEQRPCSTVPNQQIA